MNMGGPLNAIFGGYNLVWQYDVYTGNPVTPGVTNSPNTAPPMASSAALADVPMSWSATLRPTTGRTSVAIASIRDNQNSLICCLSDFAYPATYTFGNEGKNTFYTQRALSARASRSARNLP